jgi:hypothetical protein
VRASTAVEARTPDATSSSASCRRATSNTSHRQSAGGGRSPDQYLQVSARPQFQDILRAAPAGAVDPDVVFDILLGAIFARTIVPTIAARRPPLERTADLLVRMLRPTTQRAGR